MFVWLNDRIVGPDEAHVAINDHGLVVGDGAFETLKTVRREPFAVTRHLQRLERSLTALSIPMPDHDQVREGIAAAIAACDYDEARVRVTVTGGAGPLGSGAPWGEPTVIVAVTEFPKRGVPEAITVEWTRNERSALAGLKTTSYAENVRALRAAYDAGASEAIFANTVGELCEGTGTNVIVAADGAVLTPPLSSGCLAGITRELVLEVAEIEERPLPFDVLQTADEVILVSSTRDVQGLTRIDDRQLEVGPVARQLSAAFDAIQSETTDP